MPDAHQTQNPLHLSTIFANVQSTSTPFPLVHPNSTTHGLTPRALLPSTPPPSVPTMRNAPSSQPSLPANLIIDNLPSLISTTSPPLHLPASVTHPPPSHCLHHPSINPSTPISLSPSISPLCSHPATNNHHTSIPPTPSPPITKYPLSLRADIRNRMSLGSPSPPHCLNLSIAHLSQAAPPSNLHLPLLRHCPFIFDDDDTMVPSIIAIFATFRKSHTTISPT